METKCQHCGTVVVKSHGRSLLQFKSTNCTWWDPEKSQVSGQCKGCGKKWEASFNPNLPNPLTSTLALA